MTQEVLLTKDQIAELVHSQPGTTRLDSYRVHVDNRLARELLRNPANNRKVNEPHVLSLLQMMTSGAFENNADPVIIINGTITEGKHRMTAASRLPDGVYVWMDIFLEPPINNLQHVILTSSAARTKTLTDRADAAGVNHDYMKVALQYSNLRYGTDYNSHLHAKQIVEFLQADQAKFQQAWQLIEDQAYIKDQNGKPGNKLSPYAIEIAKTSRIRLHSLAAIRDIAADCLLACPSALSAIKLKDRKHQAYDYASDYVTAFITKSPYPADHPTELVRQYVLSLLSDEERVQERRQEILWPRILQGFCWHYLSEHHNVKHPIARVNRQAWGIKFNRQKQDYQLKFLPLAGHNPDEDIEEVFEALELTIP